MMIWQWSEMAEKVHLKEDIPKVNQDFFFNNEYNSAFASLVLKELKIELAHSKKATFGPRGVFIPFDLLRSEMSKDSQNGIEDNIKKMREIAIIVEKIIMHLNQCLTYDEHDKLIKNFVVDF